MQSYMRDIRLAAFAAALLAVCRGAAFGAAAPRTLKGHVPPQVRSATRLARVDPAENVELSLVVGVDQALMDRALAEMYGPSGARRPLTSAEFAGKFDLAAKRQALKEFAAAAGLAVDVADDPRSLVVKVSGPSRLVEKAFGLQLNHYRAADGQVFRGHETDPVIPGALAPHLRAVMGLSNYRGAHKPHLRVLGRVGAASGSVFPGTGPGNSLAPADIKSIYGLTLSLTGAGQKVALLELDGYAPADITTYETQFGLINTPVTFVGVDLQTNLCGAAQNLTCNATTFVSDGGMTEVALDIDMVLAISDGINQLLVYTPPNTSQGLIDAYNQMAVDNTAKSISTSWGLDEKDSGGAFMAAEAAIFSQMALNGQTIFAASGDGGAYDNDGASTPLIVVTDDPASQPYVTGVGGTTLSGTITSHSEVVWNEGCAAPGTGCLNAGASGGGIANYCENGSGVQVACPGSANYFPLPSWQSGVAGSASQSFRNVPDVALNADPHTFPYGVAVAGAFYFVGGTSAAAPLWGGLMALINQKRAANGYSSLGFANQSFYQLGSGGFYSSYFNDIQSGNNGAYSAGAGYDNATGWGSFKADALIGVLSAPLAPASAPSNLSAVTLGQSSIQYAWNAVLGATGYDVYYATNSSQVLALAIQPPYTQTGLIGNEISGVFVFAENQGIEGPGAFITTATYAAAPGAPAVAAGFVSSATFTYASCPAFPAASSCSGYIVQASTAANFAGTLFSTSTPNSALTALSFPPSTLAPVTGYFMRLGYLNPKGAPSFENFGATFNTGSNLVAPVSPLFDQVTASSIRFSWGQGSNPSGITYSAQASTAANFSGTLLTMTGTPLQDTFSGLSSDASYYFRVQGLGGPYLLAGPQASLAAAPAVSTNSFAVVGANGLTLAWSGANDQVDTLYQADVSPDPAFLAGVASAQVRTPVAAFSGLVANTPYYARVEAVGRLGGIAGPVALGATTTLVLTPTAPAISALGTNSLSFSFNSANPAGTSYLVQVATDATFSPIKASANTTATSAAFSGLLSNQSYVVEVAALNQAGSLTAFVAAPTTTTLAAVPLPAAVPVTTFTATTFGFAWAPGTLAPGTTYLAEVSSSPVFSPGFILASSQTINVFASYTGLQPNTTYYGQVSAQAPNLSTNPNSAFLVAAIGATLPIAPPAAAAPFLEVAYTSATVAWQALPLAPSSAAAEGYLVQFSTAADFTTVAFSSAVGPGASTATVSGLIFATPYFARVGSIGWEGAATFLALGSTRTALPPLSSGTVTSSGLTLALPRAFAALTSISVFVPPGAFPLGTPISVLSTLSSTIAGGRSNEAGAITPFGPAVGIDLSAGGLQPAIPVRVMMGYDPTQIPAGASERQLLLWRYDVGSWQWTLVPSQVDTSGHMLTAYTPHFSTFAPFFVAAGTDVDAVQVFPQPWEIGDAASQYWSSALTFSGLPASAAVKIFTITGELVWSGDAAASGVLTWNGNNRFGRRASSGTYYAAFQSGGKTKTRRVVIIR